MATPHNPYVQREHINSGAVKYPNPFFDMSRTHLPKNIKSLFNFCKYFFYKNDLLHSIVMKLTEYPITDILFDHDTDQLDEDVKKKYKDGFAHLWKLKALLVSIGMDYHVFGNSIISVHQKFKRYLTCTHEDCQHSFQVSNATDKQVKFSNFKYEGTCPVCTRKVQEFKVEDRALKTPETLNFVRWAPEQIEIDYDPLTGDSKYYYILNSEQNKAIRSGNREKIDRMPWLYVQALQQKKKIMLDNRNIYHLKRPTLADKDDMGWGKPAILPALGLIWYMQTLRRANEAIAQEHIVPKKAIFPAASGSMDPYSMMNLGKWRGEIHNQVNSWKKDPNNIGVFPIPIGYQSLGGDARVHMITPEIQAIEEQIIVSMGLPAEFVKGGVSWSGASISLRIVENHFLAYREMLLDFLNYFFIPKIHMVTGLPKIRLKFKEFRMSDDSETKAMMIQLTELGKLSDTKLLEAFGQDVESDKRFKEEDMEHNVEMQKKMLIGEAEAQASTVETQMRAQAQGEEAYVDEKARIKEQLFEEQIINELAKAGYNTNIHDYSQIIQKFAVEVSSFPDPTQQEQILNKMSASIPTVAQLVQQRIQLMSAAMMMMTGKQGVEEAPEEETGSDSGEKKKPNNKTQSKTGEKGEKHTAPKKGNI